MAPGREMKRILVADVRQMDDRYKTACAGWELAFVRTLSEARQALAGARYDLVAIGVYFDDSQMFDLVRLIRAQSLFADLPIVCVRGQPGFTAITTRTLEMTVKALAANDFVDLLQLGGEAAACAALRAAFERVTSSSKPTSAGTP
jgi:DNA-binding response OmpR family regulator